MKKLSIVYYILAALNLVAGSLPALLVCAAIFELSDGFIQKFYVAFIIIPSALGFLGGYCFNRMSNTPDKSPI
jgi:hypothetical protein